MATTGCQYFGFSGRLTGVVLSITKTLCSIRTNVYAANVTGIFAAVTFPGEDPPTHE